MPEGLNTADVRYSWNEARRDAVAGMTVAAIALPQAMAYALIAGIDPRFGLYSAIVVTAVASIFGSSSHLINGPTNAISLVVFSAVALLNLETPAEACEAVFLLAIMVGIIQILVAVFKLGDLTRYISESVVLGFMAGAALLIVLSQIGNLFGLQEQGTGHHHILHRLWLTLTSGDVMNPCAVGVSLGTVLLVILLRRLVRRYHLPRLDMLLALAIAAGLFDWQRLKRACHASRYDAGLVLATAVAAVVISVEFSILIGVTLSILMFVPRAARLKATELAVSAERTLRERQPIDPPCSRMVILDLEGEFFFGAAPELDRYLESLTQRAAASLRVVVLRVKRTRNPDMVCMERLKHWLEELERREVTVLLAGVRSDFLQAMHNLHFHDWFPAERVFPEDPAVVGSATLSAVRYAYDLLGDDVCEHCPSHTQAAPENSAWYYVI